MLHRRKKAIQVCNIIRVSNWRQNFHFCVDYHFNKHDLKWREVKTFFYRHLWSNLRMKKRTWVTGWSIPARFTLTDIRRHTLAAVFTMSVTHHWENTKVLAHNHYEQNSLYLEICKCLLTSFTSWSHVAVRASAVVSGQTAATVLTRRITASWETRCVNSYNIPGNPQNMQKAENSYAESLPSSQVGPLYPAGHSHTLGFTHFPLFLQSGRHTADGRRHNWCDFEMSHNNKS